MSTKKATQLFFFSIVLILISACTQKQFNVLQPIDANAPAKTPSYYNPNNQRYGLPKNHKPTIENQFYWKSSDQRDLGTPD